LEDDVHMTKRRDLFIMAALPGKEQEAQETLSKWLRQIDGQPGYLGGAVLRETAGELLPNTLVLSLDFESTEAARAFWPTIEGPDNINPIYPDDRKPSPDQGAVLFVREGEGDDAKVAPAELRFDRGGGTFARLLHVHAEAVDEFTSVAS
jgi:hypothetical protein